jgi:hypothetical protein
MINDYYYAQLSRPDWYLVSLDSGSQAVVSGCDLELLMEVSPVREAVVIPFTEGRLFEENRAREGLCPRAVE